MDRLTGEFKGASMFATVEQARQYNRLRQYEDTGLTPDEIAALRAELEATRNMYDGAKAMLFKFLDTGMKPDEIERMKAELDAAQRRASAAVRDISQVCDTCKHDLEDDEISAEICGACGRDTKWEWRGPDAPSKEVQP